MQCTSRAVTSPTTPRGPPSPSPSSTLRASLIIIIISLSASGGPSKEDSHRPVGDAGRRTHEKDSARRMRLRR
ncbi:hypothetical protein GW17_00038203 [Ensete ventricosum]|nr:hypothetical protein GW17_00038203 [Ensete ventricosum]RZR81846.1 hypothetical protein BHM03_00008150 [Ensete ventricosum]